MQNVSPDVYGDNSRYGKVADAILAEAGVSEGFCVDLGCGNGALAYELALRSDLRIYCVDSDPKNVIATRRLMNAAGLYGVRVTAHLADPAATNYPKYFADLVVSRASWDGDLEATSLAEESTRLARPGGGVICIGSSQQLASSVRPPLEGAGNWTHQYADPANSCCSADEIVQGTLGMLWFRDVDLDMPQRHGRGPAPLFYEGKLIVEGMDAMVCVDAYNGRKLWEYPLPGILHSYDSDHLMGTAGTGSNFCVADGSVYVRNGDHCLRIDVATGELLARFEPPTHEDGSRGIWGYIACTGGRLFGSLVNRAHVVKWRYKKGDMTQQFTESSTLFALDAKTGETLWAYRAADSIRHNAIAIGDKHVFLIDRPLAGADLLEATKEEAKAATHSAGKLLALEVDSGKTAWETAEDVYGTMLALSPAHDALLMSYQPTRFRLESEIGGRLSVYRASTGAPLWQKRADYASRPLINDQTIYAQGAAFDLLSGETRAFPFNRSYGCGILAGGAHMMVFRSATLGYFNLKGDGETENYGGLRPGCWINAIPAGGMVLVPDASAGCVCSYLNRAWIALAPTGD